MTERSSLVGKTKGVYYFDIEDNFIEWKSCKSIEKSYWTAVFENLNFKHKIIVTENTKYLPEYGDDIVVILKSDEFASNIGYVKRVKAVFRNYFNEKYSDENNIFFLPLPYLGELNNISMPPILKRNTDIFFAGRSIYSERRRLSRIILDLKNKYQNLNILFKENDKFFSGWNIKRYLDKLNNSKICLCPAGASRETYRHLESLRHGCVAISTPLPRVWYFQGAPIQIIENWDKLPIILEKLLEDTRLLERISQDGINFWNHNLSPKAVADFIDSSLGTLKTIET